MESKLVTFMCDKDLIESFNQMYNDRSLFLRKCLEKCLTDRNFYYDIILNRGTENDKQEK